MQDLMPAVETQIDATQSRPVNLIELGLDVGTLRFAATKTNLVFPTGGNTYTAKAMQIGNVQESKEGQLIRVEFAFDNVATDMHAYNAAEKFDGKSIIWKKVYRDALGSALNYREMFNGYMEEPHAIDKEWLRVYGVMGKALGRRMLQEYYQRQCNNLFGDAKCNYDGNADLTSLTASGTADSGTNAQLSDSALTQGLQYWNFGRIEITIDGIKYYRIVDQFSWVYDTVVFDVPLRVAVSNGDAYTIYKGCPKTWDACQASNNYGPSADNKANFNGWIHIGEEE